MKMLPIEIKGIDGLKHGAKFKGVFDVEVKDELGNLISKSQAENIITDQGLNHILNVVLEDTAKIATWYLVMFESDTTPDGDETYAVPVYTEFESFTEAVRPVFNNATSTAQSTTNSANKGVFTVTASKTLYGAGIVGGGTDPSVMGDTAGGGVLFCCGKFTASQPVVAANVVNLTYTVTAADAG